MDSFYGQILRNRFPQLSRIRRDDGSVGAKIFDNLGNEFSDVRKKVFNNGVRVRSTLENCEASLDHLFYKEIESSEYFFNRSKCAITSITCSDATFEEALSEHDIYSKVPRFIQNIPSKNYVIDRVVFEFTGTVDSTYEVEREKGNRLYINIQQFENIDQNIGKEEIYICIRGLDKNLKPIEEYIRVHDVGMYRTKKKFITVEPIFADVNKNIIGGASFEVSGAKTIVGEVLNFPVQSWEESSRYFYSSLTENILPEPIKKKRIKIQNNLSAVFLEKNFFNVESLRDNELYIEVFKTSSKSYIRYIHSYVYDAQDYKNVENMQSVIKEEGEEFFFETEDIILEQELLNTNGESFIIEDFYYDDVANVLFTIEDNLTIKIFELGKSKINDDVFGDEDRVKRTRKKELSIEATQQRILKDTFNYYKILCYNNIKPIKNFFIGRYSPSNQSISDIKFYDRIVNRWEDYITLNSGIFGAVDDLDSISIFNFEDVLTEDGEYAYYVFSYHDSRKVSELIDKFNNNIREGLDITSNLKEIENLFHTNENDYFIEELKVVTESNRCIREFTDYVNEGNSGYDGIFLDKQSKKLFVSANDSVECLEAYNKSWFFKNNKIYSNKELDPETVFTINFENNESVSVTI